MSYGSKVDGLLRRVGFSDSQIKSKSAVRAFQRGFGFGLLATDGDPGPLTLSALEWSADRDGACTPHFFYREFRSKGDGSIRLHRDLPRGLEVVRTLLGRPITIVSGYRDPARNQREGGAPQSVHLSGGAADSTFGSLRSIMALGIFSGIGAGRDDRIVRHVDVRGADSTVPNGSGGRPNAPTLWGYDPKTGRAVAAPSSWSSYPANGPGLPALLTWKGDPASTPQPEPADPTSARPTLTAADREAIDSCRQFARAIDQRLGQVLA